MKHRTSLTLMVAHAIAFLMLFGGTVAPGPAGNFITAIGLVVEFPGWFVGHQILHLSKAGTLGFAAVANAALYYAAGLLIDAMSANRPA